MIVALAALREDWLGEGERLRKGLAIRWPQTPSPCLMDFLAFPDIAIDVGHEVG